MDNYQIAHQYARMYAERTNHWITNTQCIPRQQRKKIFDIYRQYFTDVKVVKGGGVICANPNKRVGE